MARLSSLRFSTPATDMRATFLALLTLGIVAGPACAAGPIARASDPETLSVTIYRDPERSEGQAIDRDWPTGFALITETRTVDLPAGDSEVRFEGVAGGIIPVSAIVNGFPGGTSEKNQDARLLSPGALVDAALGRNVHIRRTDRATGRVTESEAIILAGPNGIVLRTADGVEALRCGGLPETLVYGGVPAGLSDRPTLSVSTTSATATRATVRLSYLATRFDWQANYIARVRPDGRRLDLFAWLTLANGNNESFPLAQTQTVAGSLNRDEQRENGRPSPPSFEINLQCWSEGTTSDVGSGQPPPPSVMAEAVYAIGSEDIVVTGSRVRERALSAAAPVTVISAEQEELGDLKLYRIPEPVTVAANAQKQVALLSRTEIPFVRLYGGSFSATSVMEEPQPLEIILRMENKKEARLGLPLPTGGVAVFEQVDGRDMLVGETSLADTAVGERLELKVGVAPDVRVHFRHPDTPGRDDMSDEEDLRREREITNAGRRAAVVELELPIFGDWDIIRPSQKLGMKNGRYVWRVRVKPHAHARLAYQLKRLEVAKEDDESDEDEV